MDVIIGAVVAFVVAAGIGLALALVSKAHKNKD